MVIREGLHQVPGLKSSTQALSPWLISCGQNSTCVRLLSGESKKKESKIRKAVEPVVILPTNADSILEISFPGLGVLSTSSRILEVLIAQEVLSGWTQYD